MQEAEEPKTLDNSKLLLLIDKWIKAKKSKKRYNDVMAELTDGDSFLIIETNNQMEGNELDPSGQPTKMVLSFYEAQGNNYLCAFTDLELFKNWAQRSAFYAHMPAISLLDIIDSTWELYGVIINTGSSNTFVVYPKCNT